MPKNEYDKVDFSIYEVLHMFIKYVKKPKNIDNLILTHKYVTSIWKNGSRFLYFYTLHNQEHSIELIKSVVNLCKNIDYFQIKSEDYYILFLSCYLHDISMVLQPDTNLFINENDETDKIYTSFCVERKNHDLETKEDIKKLMKLSFEKVCEYFGTLTRDHHAYNSAKFIRKTKDLNFLNKEIIELVASVSEAHAFQPNDVYGLKSKAKAKAENISEKYIMILLRLADLLDVSKDRVSLNILKYNISNMPEISQFHWVTHAIIDKYNIYSSYTFDYKPSNAEFVTVIKPENLTEIITVEIKLNASNLTTVKSLNCKNTCATLSIEKNEILIELGEDKSCNSKNCSFLCKWFFMKNNYLQEELNALKLYLKRNHNNIFNTKIRIKLSFEDSMPLPDNYYDIVRKQIVN